MAAEVEAPGQVSSEDSVGEPEATEMTENENNEDITHGNEGSEATEGENGIQNEQGTGNDRVIEVDVHESVV